MKGSVLGGVGTWRGDGREGKGREGWDRKEGRTGACVVCHEYQIVYDRTRVACQKDGEISVWSRVVVFILPSSRLRYSTPVVFAIVLR